ncbi:hypothetical protein AWB80_02901 [Caballeronia pedi]|uniref:Uncharacterized protein n=1 Tax=Caballeronia pedi TaxID=1777141 RepID=A0A158B0D4_9BURK|nr:hypothetical protein [Caballeronia pedi]SAK63681.1 hypothetical protein AWB80_02901 [Caballeronia pedi]
MRTIECTPTWRGLLPFLIERAAKGDKGPWSELERLADFGDQGGAQLERLSLALRALADAVRADKQYEALVQAADEALKAD